MIKLFNRVLSLKLGDIEYRFQSLREFEFALAGRTSIPASKMAELTGLSPEQLKQEARDIKKIEKHFVDLLTRSIEDPDEIHDSMLNLDLHLFSHDHQWREIMAALRDRDRSYDELKRVALVKYMQYLSARQDLIKLAYSLLRKIGQNEQRQEEENDETADNLVSGQTILIEAAALQQRLSQSDPMPRLPKGEEIIVQLEEDEGLPILLSRHRFLLRRQGQLEWVDLNGITQQLGQGKNIIGRDEVCNIRIDAAYSDISRLHLVIEPMEGQQLRITDLSSHGTALPVEKILNQSPPAPESA